MKNYFVITVKKMLEILKSAARQITEIYRRLCRTVRKTGLTAGKKAALICIGLLTVVVFLMYGPYKGLSDLYITTAMYTSDHKYLAEMFYSDAYIQKVLERNGVTEIQGVSQTTSGTASEENPHREPEFIEIKDRGYKGYLIKVYDPCGIDIVSAGEDSGKLIEEIAEKSNAIAAINASGYVSSAHTDIPNGIVIYDRDIVHICDGDMHSFFAIDKNGKLTFGMQTTEEIMSAGYRSLVEFGPILMLNGVPSDIKGYGTGISARTAIGQTESGEVLLLVIDGMQMGSVGATLSEVQEIMAEYGAVNAISLDGGSSSSMYFKGKVINSPSQGDEGRIIPNAIVVN